MSNTEQPQTTLVKGYFNPNPYRVNVSISELNISFPLEPQQFVKVRGTGQKVNDPIFDRFVGAKMLSPELSDKPVPVIRIPVVAPAAPVQPGYVVGQGHKDKTGKWVPPVAAAQPAPPAPASPDARPVVANHPSIKGMSIEEARRLGFIGKQRIVDENYGAAETDGVPQQGANIPPIKYSIEAPAPRARQSGELPKELVEGVRPDVAPVIQQLASAAQANPESPDLSRKAAENATREQMGEKGVKMFKQAVKTVKAAAKAVVPASAAPAPAPARTVAAPVPPPKPAPVKAVAAPVKRKVADVLPPPPVEELGESAEALSPLVGGADDDLPQPNLEAAAPAPAPAPAPVSEAVPVEPKPTKEDREDGKGYKCGACGKDFPYKSYYVRHIQRAHKDRLQELMPT